MNTTGRVNVHLTDCNLRYANRLSCAAALAMSTTTLGRRLRAEGVQFSDLLDAERHRRCAALYDRNPRPDAALVMRVTGFRGTSSVTRGMRRWFGASLIDMRMM